MVPIETYEELMALRRNAVAQGNASLRAEGLEVPHSAEIVIHDWVHGLITSTEMEDRIADLHGLPR